MKPESVFYRIVVPTDFSTCAEQAWSLARRLARAVEAELVLVHVLVETPLFSETPFTMGHARDVFAAARQWAEEMLDKWVAEAHAEGLKARATLRTGSAHQEIVTLVVDERADLVVVGTHGRGGLNRALLGSVADRVIRLSPCPVLAVREPERP